MERPVCAQGNARRSRRQAERRAGEGVDDESTRKRLLDLGADLPDKAGRSPEALQKLVASEIARWGKVLKGQGASK